MNKIYKDELQIFKHFFLVTKTRTLELLYLLILN